jgi:hypothetical protein
MAVQHRIFSGARHIDGHGGKPGIHDRFGNAQPIFFPAVDPAPMQYYRRPGHTRRPLQIPDQFGIAEWQLDDLKRRIKIFRRLTKHAERMAVSFELAR